VRRSFVATLLVLTLPSLASVGCSLLWPEATGDPPEGPKLTYLLPVGFSGWACVDFGVAGAPALEQEGGTLVIRPRGEEVLQASNNSTDILYATTTEVFEEGPAGRQALSFEILRTTSIETVSNDPVARHCTFFGTEEQSERAADSPETDPRAERRQHLSGS
jgi:hypothetical protein